MKVLLTAINAKYIHSNLAVYSLKAYAKKHLSDCLREDGIRKIIGGTTTLQEVLRVTMGDSL